MPTTYKVLGQINPNAYSYSDAYTAANQAVVSTITICNRDVNTSSYRIAVQKAAEYSPLTPADKTLIAYEITVAPKDTTTLTLGVTMATGDVITVWAATNYLTFNIFGSEIS